jgi:hypothetical protein
MAKSAGFNWLKPLSGLLLSLSCTLAMAQSMAEPLPPLRFVEQADWAPFTPKAQGKTSEGLAYELLQLIFNQFGRSAQLELLPLTQVLQRAKLGQAGGISVTHLDEWRIT